MRKYFAALLLLMLTAAALAQPSAPIKDPRDGKTYRTVKIGEQVWMAENLGYEIKGSKCYDNKKENCVKYGSLYDWKTAMKACPNGWHISSNAEWDVLYKFVDNSYVVAKSYSETAGKRLKAKSGWHEWHSDGKGEDTYGFAALPGGFGDPDGSFGNDVGDIGYWWTASEHGANYAYYRNMFYDIEQASWGHSNNAFLFSVRCVRD